MNFLGPDLLILLIFFLVWVGLGFIFGQHILHFIEGSVFYALGSFLIIEFVYLAFQHPRIIRGTPAERQQAFRHSITIARDWVPFAVLIAVYESLRDYTALIRPDSIDMTLYKMDLAMFGVEPTVWAQRFAHPLLTDYLAFTYTLYLILPLTLGLWLYLKNRRQDFLEMSMALIIVLYVGFILYCIFPAGPPRHFAPIIHQFSPPQLPSYWFFKWAQGQMDNLTVMPTRSSFPSLHCACSALALFYAARFGNLLPRRPRTLVWVYAVPVVSLWISTVYLRHHWIPDIAAGILLAFFAYAISPKIRKWYDNFSERM